MLSDLYSTDNLYVDKYLKDGVLKGNFGVYITFNDNNIEPIELTRINNFTVPNQVSSKNFLIISFIENLNFDIYKSIYKLKYKKDFLLYFFLKNEYGNIVFSSGFRCNIYDKSWEQFVSYYTNNTKDESGYLMPTLSIDYCIRMDDIEQNIKTCSSIKSIIDNRVNYEQE